MKTLSIIIPAYNMESLLGQCLDSLVAAKHNEQLDIIVVNDGSHDHTSDIAHQYSERHSGIVQVIDKPNGHYGSCVNSALPTARGKYVKLLDADDMFSTAGLGQLLDFLATTDADMVITDYEKITIDGKPYRPRRHHFPADTPMTIDEFVKQPSASGVKMHALTWRTQMLRDIHYHQPEGILYTDDVWRFTPLIGTQTVVFTPITVYQYRTGRDGQSMDAKVMQRSAHDFLSLAQHKLDILEQCRGNVSAALYASMQEQIAYNAGNVLKYGIMYGGLTNVEMMAFDERVSQICPAQHKRVESMKKFRFGRYNYIKHWRAKPQTYRFPLLLKVLCRINDCIKNTIQQYKHLIH